MYKPITDETILYAQVHKCLHSCESSFRRTVDEITDHYSRFLLWHIKLTTRVSVLFELRTKPSAGYETKLTF